MRFSYGTTPPLSPPQVAPLDSPIVPDALGGGPKGIVITRADGDKGDDSGATLRGDRVARLVRVGPPGGTCGISDGISNHVINPSDAQWV